MRNIKIALYLICFILLSITMIHAETLVLDSETLSGKQIGKSLEYYPDESGAMEINDFLTGSDAIEFMQSSKDSLSFGYTSHVYWLKLSVLNPGDIPQEWYLQIGYPLLDDITFFYPENNGYKSIQVGDIFSYDERPYNHENFIFTSTTDPGESTYYLRVKSESSMNLPITVWSRKTLDNHITNERLLLGLYFGILLVMFIYNFFIFLATRDQHYIYYVGFIGAYILLSLSLNGLGFKLLWSSSPLLNNSPPFTLGVAILMAFLFARSYFSTWKNSRKINILLLAMAAIGFLLAVTSWGMSYQKSLRIISAYQGFSALFLIFLGVYFTLKKVMGAKYFILAWIAIFVGSALTMFKNAGIMPNNFITIWGFQLGSVIQIILFSLGLADKINRMKNELKVLNTDLEGQVEKRTEELQSAMEEMEAMNDELITTRDALWGEMELAKKIQTVLLPERPEMENYDIAGFIKPADEVGGDYYDVINVEGMDWVVIGDVSGHGVPAGLVMMMVQTSINTVLRSNPEMSPSKLLEVVNLTIANNIRRLGEDKYMTITVLASHKEGSFYFSGLHQDIHIYRAKTEQVESIETNGMWLGIMEDIQGMMEDDKLLLEKGDTMLLYTDGITEAWEKSSVKDNRDPEKEMYGDDRLVEVFKGTGQLDSKSIINTLVNSMAEYYTEDDVTMLVIKRLEN